MKIKMLTAAISRNFSRFAIAIAVLVTTTSMAPAAGTSSRKSVAPKVRSLKEQIRQYIDVNDSSLPNLSKGIVVISFSVDENNRLKNVVSHSQIPVLDQYLKSALEGRTILTDDANYEGKQFVRLRFAIEK